MTDQPTPQDHPAPALSYFQQRCAAIGLTPERNQFTIPEFPAIPDSKLITWPLMVEEDKQEAGIIIPVYDLNGHPCVYDRNKDTPGKTLNAKAKPFEIIRYHPEVYRRMCERAEKEGRPEPGKYNVPKGAKSVPWIAPSIIEAYRKKQKLHTIVLTEGYIKAICGWLNGLHIFGLSSISTYRDKDTGTLHPDILAVIDRCEVENIVLLYDGDCNQISLKALEAGKDLYKRPAGFFSSAMNICELLKDHRQERHFDIYFAHPNTADLEGAPKGLDDLYEAYRDDAAGVTKELTSFSKQKQHYFTRFNITASLYKVREHLKINSAETFYTAHNQLVKEKAFIFHGTKYQWDPEKKVLKVVVPGAAKRYFRVGDEYYEKLMVPNERGKPEYRYDRRSKDTIKDDHGKDLLPHIPKYKAFCVVPDHTNYQEVIDGCFNAYRPFEHTPSEDPSCPTIMEFMNHIFGHQIDIGLDYVQLLYQKPTEKLYILCLVSREQQTGKTTFVNLMKAMFTGNMAIIGNDQLENKFNASWADKLIIACEESFIEKKKTVEKIKALSTGNRIEMERKGVDGDEISFFGKFILNSNNETNFTLANETDTRYWVVKVPVSQNNDPHLLDKMIEEIPNFLCFLNRRKLSVPVKESRMWFAFHRIRTDAFTRLVEANKSGPQRELTTILRNLFTDCGFWRLQMPLKYIHETLFKGRYSKEYLEKMLHEKFNRRTGATARLDVPEIQRRVGDKGAITEEIVIIKLQGRPYTFYANEFLSEPELAEFRLSE